MKFKTFKGLGRLQGKYRDLTSVGQFRWHWKDQMVRSVESAVQGDQIVR